MLPDGRYDVFVVDASHVGPGDVVLLEVTILAGEQKGEVVAMRAEGLGIDEIDLLGTPGTLVVADGRPAITLEG